MDGDTFIRKATEKRVALLEPLDLPSKGETVAARRKEEKGEPWSPESTDRGGRVRGSHFYCKPDFFFPKIKAPSTLATSVGRWPRQSLEFILRVLEVSLASASVQRVFLPRNM